MKHIGTLLIGLILLGATVPNAHRAAANRRQEITLAEVNIRLELVVSNLMSPIYVTQSRDQSQRLFIVEQSGRILVLQPGQSMPTVFLNLTGKIVFGGERGLLGLAFHPQYALNGRFFVNYTRSGDGATVLAEYHVSPGNPDVADPAETILLTFAQPFSNHNGGMIEFGPDGFLYIATGDGGSANDPGNRAQNITELLGKMLRIDVNQGTPYGIPSDNPFVGTAGRNEIFAIGLRNPWRFSFDRQTGQLYAGDVGQNAIEEVDIITRGGNYGWRVFEGTQCTNNAPVLCPTLNHTPPITQYNHTGGRCSITGGYVYRGTRGTLPAGTYLYADFCTGEIFRFNGSAPMLLLDTNLSIASFGEDESGELYVVGIGGTVHRIVALEPSAVQISSASLRRRATGNLFQPIVVKSNGKKYDIVVQGTGFLGGTKVAINGRDLKTRSLTANQIVAKLQADMLRAPGTLTIEVITSDGSRSNHLTLEVVAAAGQ